MTPVSVDLSDIQIFYAISESEDNDGIPLGWVNSVVGMLDTVLTVGWTHASETGTSCISWTVPWSLHPGTLFPCCVKARSPMEFGMIWSVLTASIPANACTLLASIQLQKLTHRPHGTEFYEEFQETHNICVSNLTSLSCLSAKTSRMTYYQQKLTKLLWAPMTTRLREFYQVYSQERTTQQTLSMCSPCRFKSRNIYSLLIKYKTINI